METTCAYIGVNIGTTGVLLGLYRGIMEKENGNYQNCLV